MGPLTLVLLAALVAPSMQHAYLAFPPSRNYQAFIIPPDAQKFYCPHCGDGGGIGFQPSMCGDPFQNVVGDTSFVPFTNRFYAATTLKAGSTVNIQITVSTNHGGRMSVAICPLPRDQVTQACFNQPQNRLRRVDPNPEYNNKWYWYLNTGNMASAQATFKLPDGVTCENGCMMQWWWLGYQACSMPCEDPSVDVPSECNRNPLNPPVGTCNNVLGTEQFYNCADIILTNSAVTTTSQSTVVASPPPATTTTTTSSSSSSSSSSTTSSTTSGACPISDWRCSSCVQGAAGSTLATSLISSCYSCATTGTDPSACAQCLKSSTNKDIVTSCLSCVARGTPGWVCLQQCAQYAQSAAHMTSCVDCVAAPGINTWGCQNCLQLAGADVGKAQACHACVKAGRDGWACGQCTTKANYAACYSCLALNPTNTWVCIG